MLKTNRDKLIKISVQGSVDHPGTPTGTEYNPDRMRMAQATPTMGGICYNANIGDCCMGIKGEHTEPGVTTKNLTSEAHNGAYNTYSCIGNVAKVVTGDAKGELGRVTGMHGGPEHVMLWFPQETLEKLTCTDQFLVKAYGFGLELTDYPDVVCTNLDPDLLDAMGIEEKDGKLIVKVAAKIPGYLMGSGKGHYHPVRGDYDLMTQDKEEIARLGLDKLRFGDIVLLEDQDNTWGRAHCRGASTIGVIIHGESDRMGHGPGITTILSSRKPIIEGVLDESANLATYFGAK
ncbi:MAG TPA: DUF4438 domain-containing protein [Candidatus Galloscillospira excrementipullorum]|nr:DUF4438 domain-containing protein [Candidatus Galloscillospira excrementipullorum]